MKNQKGFIPVIIVLVVLIGFVGVYYLGRLNPKTVVTNPTASPLVDGTEKPDFTKSTIKPTTDLTANWMTYINKQYGFVFKYPPNWKIQTGIPNSGLISLETEDNKRFFVMFHQSYSITEWLEDTQLGKIIGKRAIGEYRFTVIQGGLTLESLEYALDIKGNGFVRFVIEPNSNASESEKLFDQILSTFKFTN